MFKSTRLVLFEGWCNLSIMHRISGTFHTVLAFFRLFHRLPFLAPPTHAGCFGRHRGVLGGHRLELVNCVSESHDGVVVFSDINDFTFLPHMGLQLVKNNGDLFSDVSTSVWENNKFSLKPHPKSVK